jgi:hypothetical protein
MDGREKPHMNKYKEIISGCKYDYITFCLGLRKFEVLDFCCTECTLHMLAGFTS